MPRPAFTLETAQQRLDERFPDSGVKLVEFTKALAPCKVHCPKHGVQVVSKFNSLLYSSRHPCPKCGREVSLTAASEALVKGRPKTDAVKELLSIVQQPLSNAEFGAKVRQLFTTKD